MGFLIGLIIFSIVLKMIVNMIKALQNIKQNKEQWAKVYAEIDTNLCPKCKSRDIANEGEVINNYLDISCYKCSHQWEVRITKNGLF